MNNISCVKLIVRISGRIWDVTVWSAPTAFLWIMGRLSSFPQMSVIITNVSGDNGRLSRLPRSSFSQLVQCDTVDELVIVMCDYASLRGPQTCRVFICCGNYGRGVDSTKKHHNLLYTLWGLLSQKARFQTGLTLLIRWIWCVILNAAAAWTLLVPFVFFCWVLVCTVVCAKQSAVHRVRVYRAGLAHDKKQNSISLPSFPPCFLGPQMALHALRGWGGGGRGMLLNKRGRGELESLLHCNSEDAIKTCMNEQKNSMEEVAFVCLDCCERVRGRHYRDGRLLEYR